MIALTDDYALRDKSLRKQDRLNMLAEAHQQAAEDIEKTIVPLQATSYAARVVIEGAWGAAFHWIAFGCETKHQNHQENHARLGTFLRRQGEGAVAEWWEDIDRIRQGGWYGGRRETRRCRRVPGLF